jgi:hypothetical protein
LPDELIDSDGDGMPDGWEQAHNLNPNLNDAGEDPDHDGMTNYQEFIAGTNPRDANDFLRLQPLVATGAAGSQMVVLGFEARSNKTYTIVYRNTAEGTGWTNLVNVGFATTNRFVTFTDTLQTNASTRFYRLASPRVPK